MLAGWRALLAARRAHVVADVQKPTGASAQLALAEIEPGVFEASLPAPMAGIYPIRFRANGNTLRGHPFTREQLRTAAVWRGGDAQPPAGTTQPTPPGVDWCDLLACLLSQRSVLAWLDKQGFDVEEIRRCLKGSCGGGQRSPILDALMNRPELLELLAQLRPKP